jgi:Trypsin-like peptidase domain
VISLFRALSTVLLLISMCSAATVKENLVPVHGSIVSFYAPLIVRHVDGSGICINQNCSVVVTAYHLQIMAGRTNLSVASERTRKVLSLAGESDTNKSHIPVGTGKNTLYYNIANDVSFVYTRKPVRHKSGVPYSYKFYVGEKVQVAGYCNNKFETKEAHIIGSNVPLVIGQAQLNENLVLDTYVRPGTSGSAVLDERGNLLGMIILSGTLKFSSGPLATSVALPVRTIAKALVKVDPVLGSAVFNDIPEEEPKPTQISYVLYQEYDLPEDTSPVIPALSAVPTEVPNSVGKLRLKSEAASARMVNFVAKQCVVQGTQKPLCHELAIVDGRQTFRAIGKNGKLHKPTGSFPVQRHGVWSLSDWTDTLGEIADNPWVFQGSVGDHYLFTFRSAAEDDRCHYEEYSQGTPLFGGGHPGWKGSVICFEQILTDKDFNVLSVFTEMRPPDGCLTQMVQTAIYYDWVKLEDLKSPLLLPVMERITAKVLGQKNLWYTSVSWTDYQKFRAEHKIEF